MLAVPVGEDAGGEDHIFAWGEGEGGGKEPDELTSEDEVTVRLTMDGTMKWLPTRIVSVKRFDQTRCQMNCNYRLSTAFW